MRKECFMKITTKIVAVLGLAFGLSEAAPIDDIGALSVQGTQVVGANGQPAQLRGMSYYWSHSHTAFPFYNASVVNWLAEDWHVNLVRAAMAFETNAWNQKLDKNGYISDPSGTILQAEAVIDAAIAKGIYVIIDLHTHWANDNGDGQRWNKAAEFFEYMATKYGQYPNVIYEVYNEPGTDTWTGPSDWNPIKPYLEFIIPKIRAIDPDNLIIAGTPAYSGNLSEVANSPLTGSNAVNVAYAFHFYASTDDHLNRLLPIAKSALNTIPIFISECGLTNADGNGSLNYNSINQFWQWIDEAKLSWAAWSLSNTAETSAALQTSASTSGNWSESDLTPSGTWLRNKLRELNPEWTPIRGDSPGPAALSRPAASTSSFLFANNTVSVNLKGQSKVELLDLQGRTVRTLWNGNANGSVSLSVGTQPGIYLVRIQGQGVTETHKVAVK